MSRQITLDAVDGGINRLRSKGGAKPSELYDLLNGYVTADGGAVSRPGTTEVVQLPAGTKGLCAFDGQLVVFSHEAQTIPASTPTVVCEVISHPTDKTQAIAEIHYAAPFMQYLYVAAEFANGDVFHYWLEGSGSASFEWQAEHVYGLNEVVVPGNGLAYRATRLNPADPVWKAGEARTVGDVVEPTVFNKYKFEVVEVAGDNPRSGDTEPAWPAEDGAVAYEEVDRGTTSTTDGSTTGEPDTTLPKEVIDRYEGMR